jgi:hypothetical protein
MYFIGGLVALPMPPSLSTVQAISSSCVRHRLKILRQTRIVLLLGNMPAYTHGKKATMAGIALLLCRFWELDLFGFTFDEHEP